jgi:hypothetical protein
VGAVPPSLGPLAGCKMSNMLAPCAAVINGCGSMCQHWHLGGNGHCRRDDLRICDRRGAVPGHWYKEVCWHTLISCEEPYFLAITRRNRTGNGLILIIAVLLRWQAIQFAENSALA